MPAPPDPAPVTLSRVELLWITFGTWLGGVFILAFLPVILIPRLGIPLGMATSYLVFFLAWQPVQTITQRALGIRTALIRMLVLVGVGAVLAFYLRELVLALTRE